MLDILLLLVEIFYKLKLLNGGCDMTHVEEFDYFDRLYIKPQKRVRKFKK